mmetsp:Transcript_68256/g.156715  ORF Transcript_68256/g.156715 Transcript_68256/m.156715 type:complete len:313 (+) Transcript_68256:2045-2983(+)
MPSSIVVPCTRSQLSSPPYPPAPRAHPWCGKKNWGASRPWYKLFSTKPRAFGALSPLRKCGSVRRTKPSLIRCPPTFCWPKHAIIWHKFNGDPLEPHVDIILGLLSWAREASASFPTVSRQRFSLLLMSPSSVCSTVCPGAATNFPSFSSWINLLTVSNESAISTAFSLSNQSFAITSLIPRVKPRLVIHRADSLEMRPIASHAALGLTSRIYRKNRPFLEPSPRLFFPRPPVIKSELRNSVHPSLRHMSRRPLPTLSNFTPADPPEMGTGSLLAAASCLLSCSWNWFPDSCRTKYVFPGRSPAIPAAEPGW